MESIFWRKQKSKSILSGLSIVTNTGSVQSLIFAPDKAIGTGERILFSLTVFIRIFLFISLLFLFSTMVFR